MIPLRGRSIIMDQDERLQCLRQQGITYVNGIATPASQTTFTVRANVQPLSGREILMLAEGDRESESLWIYVPETPGMTMVLNNDFILRGGYVYRIRQASNWGSYTQARIQRQDTGPDISAQFAALDPTV